MGFVNIQVFFIKYRIVSLLLLHFGPEINFRTYYFTHVILKRLDIGSFTLICFSFNSFLLFSCMTRMTQYSHNAEGIWRFKWIFSIQHNLYNLYSEIMKVKFTICILTTQRVDFCQERYSK